MSFVVTREELLVLSFESHHQKTERSVENSAKRICRLSKLTYFGDRMAIGEVLRSSTASKDRTDNLGI